jgi:hypothetical protein
VQFEKMLRDKLQQSLPKVETNYIAANWFSVAPCRHFCNLCRNAIARQVAKKIAPCIRTLKLTDLMKNLVL